MDWEVVFYQSRRGESPIEEFLSGLSVKARAKCVAYMEELESSGNRLPANYAKKVEGDLWELRPEFGGVEHRFFYFTFIERKIVIVHAVAKKSGPLKRRDIETALTRVAEVRQREAERARVEEEKRHEITAALRERSKRERS